MAKPLSRRAIVMAAAGVAATTLPISFIVHGEPADVVTASAPEPFKPPVPTGMNGKPLSGEALARWEAIQRIPGVAYVAVSLFADDDPNYGGTSPDGTHWPGGETLAEWRAKYGGAIGEVTHYRTGQTFRIDLSPYMHLDPDTTRVQIQTGRFATGAEGQRERPSGPPPAPIDPRLIRSIAHITPDGIRCSTGVNPALTAGPSTGTVQMQVSAVHLGPDNLGDERRSYQGAPLGEFRAALGGDEGEIIDPFSGQSYHLSLAPYAHADPETTYLRVQFIFTPDGHEEAIRQAHPAATP
jgi:hypothetical protein